LPLIFPHRTGAVQNDLGKKCATYVAVVEQPGVGTVEQPSVGSASRKERSHNGGFQFDPTSGAVQRKLCASTVIPDARTLPCFSTVSVRCPDARNSHYISINSITARHHFRPPDFSKADPQKKSSDIVNFLKSFEFWKSIMYQIMQMKMHGF
jgi:hypothetical protein